MQCQRKAVKVSEIQVEFSCAWSKVTDTIRLLNKTDINEDTSDSKYFPAHR